MTCNLCNQSFDPTNLTEVAEHMHSDIFTPAIIGKRLINHAREIYPYCSGDFASGVHAFLRGGEVPCYPESKEAIQGWICAQRDLKDNFIKQ